MKRIRLVALALGILVVVALAAPAWALPPTDISLSNSSVDENQLSGTTVGSFSTTDPDGDTSFTYALVSGQGSGDNGSFTISGSDLLTAASFNFEAKNSYSIRVSSTDPAMESFEKQFTISVTNVNEQPTNIALSNSSVAENRPSGTTVGNFSTTDPDSGDSFTYTLVSGAGSADNGSFSIVGSSLRTAAVFDFETQSSYSIRVRSTDSGSLSTDKQFTITIINNTAPTNIALSNSSVPENQPTGTVVGTFSTTDPNAGDTFTYTLVPGVGSTDNSSFTILGGSLRTAASFDFETKSSYSIRVRSTDSDANFFEKVFAITVTDVAEGPNDITLSPSSVQENQPAGTTVGTLTAIDPDPGDTHTFSLVSGTGSTDNAAFTIMGATLKTAQVFDFETKSSYSIRVRSTDSTNNIFEKAFLITVTNIAGVEFHCPKSNPNGIPVPEGYNLIEGTNSSDTLIGTAGPDFICALGGDDQIKTSAGNDIIYGGAGNDRIDGGAGADKIYGEDGNDVIYGGVAGDFIKGGLGDDYISAGDNNDRIDGTDGNDRIYAGAGNDLVYGGVGVDLLSGGDGDDRLIGGLDADSIVGGEGNDRIWSGRKGDRVWGQGGDDIIYSYTGDDRILGGPGNDTLVSGDGNDILVGGSGNDRIYGQYGDDRIFGRDRQIDVIDAGPGADTCDLDRFDLVRRCG